MILSKYRADITEDRCIGLDATQKKIIEKVVDIPTKNIFLWGSSGTGKTIVLTEILKIKISHYKKTNIRLNVFVTSYMATSSSQLMQDFKEKYLAYLPTKCQVRFVPFNLLCQGKKKSMQLILFTNIYNFFFF